MSTFVLVHGSWYGAWCWEKVVPLHERVGHKVVAPDLPGHGRDDAPVAHITLAGYAEHVPGVLGGLTEPVILVGHSSGGAVISEVAERQPEKVGLLIYLSAFLPPNGRSTLETAQPDEESIGSTATDLDAAKGVLTVRPDRAKDFLYGDLPEAEAARATARLVPEPLAPFITPATLSEANFGRVRQVYIECLRDRAIGPTAQRRMYTESPCEKVVSLETSHSLFLSRPQELVGHLDALARR